MSSRPRRSHRLRRTAVLVGVTALGAAIAKRVRELRPAVDAVAPDLQMPALYGLNVSLGDRALRVIRSLPTPSMPTAPGVTVESRTIPTAAGHPLRVVTYDTTDRERPSAALVWIHGGGMVLGTPEQAHPLCSRWAAELGLLVVSVDYRLAPEDPFPAGLDDCYSALQWVHEHAASLGVDPGRVAVGGDSAGGGLSAALSQLARDRNGPPICFQLLEYPMIDDRTVLRSDDQGRGTFLWTAESNRFAWTAYLGRPPIASDAPRYAAPLRTEDLAGLPPAWVGVGDLDLFYDEDVAYAERLLAADVPCVLHVQPGMYHGADSITPDRPSAKAFRDAMTEALAAGVAARTISPTS